MTDLLLRAGTGFGLLVLTATSVPAQAPLLPAPAACALTGQLPDGKRFDPNQLELVANPRPFELPGWKRKIDLSFHWLGRVVSINPLELEILERREDGKPILPACSVERIFSVHAPLGPALSQLRPNELVEATMMAGESGLERLILTDIHKVPAVRDGALHSNCMDKSGMLIYWNGRFETIVVFNDLSVWYSDAQGRILRLNKVDADGLNRVMQAFRAARFNSFAALKWPDGRSGAMTLSLDCARYQEVHVADHEAALEPIIRELKALVFEHVAYVLSYREKRAIRFGQWPLPNVAIDDVQSLANRAETEMRRAQHEHRPIPPELLVTQEKLPEEFLSGLPSYPPPGNAPDPNRDVYFRSDSRIFRVLRGPWPARRGTLHDLMVREFLPADRAFERALAGGPEPGCSSLAFTAAGVIWPADAGIQLRQVSGDGKEIARNECERNRKLYDRFRNRCLKEGFDVIEGDYSYTGVSIALRAVD